METYLLCHLASPSRKQTESRKGEICQPRAVTAVWCAPCTPPWLRSRAWPSTLLSCTGMQPHPGGPRGGPQAWRSLHAEMVTLQARSWESSSVLGASPHPDCSFRNQGPLKKPNEDCSPPREGRLLAQRSSSWIRCRQEASGAQSTGQSTALSGGLSLRLLPV